MKDMREVRNGRQKGSKRLGSPVCGLITVFISVLALGLSCRTLKENTSGSKAESNTENTALNLDQEISRVDKVIRQGIDNINAVQKSPPKEDILNPSLSEKAKQALGRADAQFWNYGYYLGSFHSSIYALYYLYFIGVEEKIAYEHFDRFREVLIEEQYPDGSWKDFKDDNFTSGVLDASILNYYVLKLMGEPVDGPVLRRARRFILQMGGVEAGTFLAKFTLAVFNNYPWDKVPRIPGIALSLIDLEKYAQWIAPNFYPVFYMRSLQMTKAKFEMPPFLRKGQSEAQIERRYRIRELFVDEPQFTSSASRDAALGDKGRGYYHSKKLRNKKSHRRVLSYFLREGGQLDRGSWGAYGPATAMGIVILKDLLRQTQGNIVKVGSDIKLTKGQVSAKIKKARAFLASMFSEAHYKHYLGLQSFGNFWDSALTGNALLDAARARDLGDPSGTHLQSERKRLKPLGQCLLTAQGSSGGFAFGHDFQEFPDADDTGEILMTFSKLGLLTRQPEHQEFVQSATKGIHWLNKLRSKDKGMPAFEIKVEESRLLSLIFQLFAPRGFLADPSSSDVSGHTLEGFASFAQDQLGGRPLDLVNRPASMPEHARKTIDYLRESAFRNHGHAMWFGKWGVNYLYGTNAALMGLFKVGAYPYDLINKTEGKRRELGYLILDSIEWLRSCQNPDGGFGETTDSYDYVGLACKGVSTPTQTAWALMPLIASRIQGNKEHDEIIVRAARYLMKEMDEKGKWHDRSVVGTGFPGFLYMRYESYPYTFPLMAVSLYKKWLVDKRKPQEVSQEVSRIHKRADGTLPFALHECIVPDAADRNPSATRAYFECVRKNLGCKEHGEKSYIEDALFKTMDLEFSPRFSDSAQTWFNEVNKCFASDLKQKFIDIKLSANPAVTRKSACGLVQTSLLKAHDKCFAAYGFCNSMKNKLSGTVFGDSVIKLERKDYKSWLKLVGRTFFTTDTRIVFSKEALSIGRDMAKYFVCSSGIMSN